MSEENTNSMINIKKSIIEDASKLSEIQQIEIFNILKANENFDFTENKNGIFINLENVSDSSINEVEKYISFCKESNLILEKKENSILLPPEPSNNAENELNIAINEHPISKIIKS